MNTEKPHKGVIKNWKVVSVSDKSVILGEIEGGSGGVVDKLIRTSYIVNMAEDKTWVETRNSIYTLGEERKGGM